MNSKYNTYDHLDKLKCVEDGQIIEIEKKFEKFSIDNNYNYATNLLEKKQTLPKFNIDLPKIIAYYKSTNDSVEDLVKEITIFNKYYESLTKWVNMSKCETLKEKSIVYYLFYFISRCFFYVIMHNNFMVSQPNTNIFVKFFQNFNQIITTAKLYLQEEIENSSIIIDEDNMNNKMEKNLKKGLYEAFAELKKCPNDFNSAIINCHNFISFTLFSVDHRIEIDGEEEDNIIDTDMLNLLEIFVISFDFLYKINGYFSILEYTKFYNDSLSKSLNIKREFRTYLHNEKVKEKQKKEKEKNKNKKNNENEKDKDKNKIKDDLKDEDDEEKDNDKIKFTLFDYMWLFNPAAKNDIILLFNENQQNSELMKFLNQDRNRESGFLSFFLNRNKFNFIINIRRDHLIEDTLNEVSKPGINFQNK